MSISMRCDCGATYVFKDADVGRPFRCEYCSHVGTVSPSPRPPLDRTEGGSEDPKEHKRKGALAYLGRLGSTLLVIGVLSFGIPQIGNVLRGRLVLSTGPILGMLFSGLGLVCLIASKRDLRIANVNRWVHRYFIGSAAVVSAAFLGLVPWFARSVALQPGTIFYGMGIVLLLLGVLRLLIVAPYGQPTDIFAIYDKLVLFAIVLFAGFGILALFVWG